jgi:hypothetical protein
MGNPDNVLVPQTGSRIYLAPVGTALPAAWDTALNAAFVDAGFISDDIPNITPSVESSEINDWVGDAVRVTTTTSWTVEIPFLETNPESLELAFGGGTWTDDGGTGVKFTPAEQDQERALVIHMVDGTFVDRFVAARAGVIDIGEVSPSAEAGTVWNITFKVLTPTSGDTKFWLSNRDDLVAAIPGP